MKVKAFFVGRNATNFLIVHLKLHLAFKNLSLNCSNAIETPFSKLL